MSALEVVGALIAALFGGGGIAAMANFLTARAKDKTAALLLERQQPIDQYSSMVVRLETRITTLEHSHQQCMEHHAECERQVGRLEGQMEEVKKQVAQNAQRIEAQVNHIGIDPQESPTTVLPKPSGIGNM